MRVLAATIGALLISVSYPALAQDTLGGPPQDEAQQGEPALLPAPSPERSAPSEQPAMPGGMSPEEFRQRELERFLAGLPDRPRTLKVETRQDEAEQDEPEQPGATTAWMPPASEAEELLAQLPDRPPAEQPGRQRSVTVTGMSPGELRLAEVERLLAELPDRPRTDQQRELEQFLAGLPDRPRTQQAESQQAESQQAETEPDEPRQPEAMKAGMEQDQPMSREWPGDPKWTALNEPSLGTTMDLPRAVFSTADGHAHKGAGRRYRTADGRAKVAVWTQRNTRRDTPASYLRRTFVIPRANVDYERFTPAFAAVSGVYGSRVFYIRCNLSPRGNLHCFDLAYPVREKKAWDVAVTRMSRSLRSQDD
jgi:hypothetical protein